MLLTDGYQTLIGFATMPSVQFAEKTVTPPGFDGGGEIDTTTMRNTALRTRHPKALITMSPGAATVAYDPDVYNDIMNLINVNDQITVTEPDGATLVFWGWLNNFTPNEHQEGEQPTAAIQIIPSNMDNSGVETLPVLTPAP